MFLNDNLPSRISPGCSWAETRFTLVKARMVDDSFSPSMPDP